MTVDLDPRKAARTPPGHRWNQVPGAADIRTSTFASAAVAAWVALVGPVARAEALPASHPLEVAGVGTVALVMIWHLGDRWWWTRVLLAVTAGALLLQGQGELIALWLTVGLVLAPWVSQSRPPLPVLPEPGPGATAPVVVLCGVAAWAGRDASATWTPLVPLAMACAVPLVSRLGGGTLTRVAHRVGEVVAAAVATVVFTLLGLLFIVVPWSLQRLLRVDPLKTTAGWSGRKRRDVRARSLWAPDPAMHRTAVPHRRRTAALTVAIVAVAVGLVWKQHQENQGGSAPTTSSAERLGVPSGTSPTGPGSDGPSSSEGGDADWYDEYREDVAWVLDERVALRPFEIYRVRDVETRHVNVHDGRRDTWTPPECDCQRLTVWLYGGSSVFGLEQRDGHTIASELARVAADQGITLDVYNQGVPGQLHWREALRFGWDVIHDPAPDLVLFYSGAEDVESAKVLGETGMGDLVEPYEPFAEDIYDEVAELDPPPGDQPASVEVVGRQTGEPLTATEIGELAAERYDRSRQISDDTAVQEDLPHIYFWQPSAYTRADREPAISADPDLAINQEIFGAAADALPADVVDLSGALDQVDEVLYADGVHLNERGARLVAEAIFAEIQPQLTELGG